MENYISMLLSSLIGVIIQVYVCGKILKKNIKIANHGTIFIIIFTLLLATFLFCLTDSFIRVIILFLVISLENFYLFHSSLWKCFVATFLSYALFGISEIVFAIFLFGVLKVDTNYIMNNYLGNLIINIIIDCMVIILIHMPFLLNSFRKMVNINVMDNKIFVIIFSILGVVISSVSIYSSYYKLSRIELCLTVLIFITIYTLIIYKFFFEKKQKEIAQNKNDILIDNISEYEKIIENQKMEVHENKNQLRIIKRMVNPTNKDLISYIETLICEQDSEDSSLLTKVQDIPNGGIRALIYSKLAPLNKFYNVTLMVSKQIDTQLLNAISNETNVDICKILGVFLDNAVESASETNDKIIGIDLYREKNYLCISISNSFNGVIDFEKIDEAKYSTKGIERGYGLALVKKIIQKNKKLINIRKINDNLFTQILRIKLKNKL